MKMFGADDNSFGNITTISGKLGIQQSQFERTWTNLKASLEYYRVRS
jgi:flagellin-like hook-associated protein FlgL